jgi:hypothetical protein
VIVAECQVQGSKEDRERYEGGVAAFSTVLRADGAMCCRSPFPELEPDSKSPPVDEGEEAEGHAD